MVRRAVWLSLLLAGLGLTFGGRELQAGFSYTSWQSQDIFKPGDPTTQVGKQTDWSSAANFNQFNVASLPALPAGESYKLEGAELKLDYQFENQISMRFDNPSTITVTALGAMNLYLPGSTTIAVPSATFGPIVQTLTLTPSDTFSHKVDFPVTYIPTAPGQQTGTVSNATDLATYFTGPGTVTLPVAAAAISSFANSAGNGFGSSLTEAWATVSIRYIYSVVVPEPSSVVLTGLGIIGLVCLARARRPAEAIVRA